MKICANCQTQCEDTMKFCSNCGAALEGILSEEVIPEETGEVIEETGVQAAEETVSEKAEEAADRIEETVIEETSKAEEMDQPTLTIEEDTSTVAIPEPQIKDAAEAVAEEAAAVSAGAAGAAAAAAEKEKAAEKSVPVKKKKAKKKKAKKKKPISVMAVLSMIFALIGLFSGAYACLFTFSDLMTAAIFFIPSLLAIVFGIIGIAVSGRNKAKRGRALAVVGLIIGALSLVFWIVGAYYLHNLVRDRFGDEDLMSAVRAILSGR